MPARWYPDLARYRDTETGRFLSRERVVELTRQSITATADVAATLTGQLTGGQLSTADFAAVLWQEVKDEHIRQYLIGRGGISVMTQADWGSVGGSLSHQRSYFQAFVTQIAGGDLSEGEIRRRAQMYVNSARESYERAYKRSVIDTGRYSEEKWNLNAGQNCGDCSDLAARGWVPIGELPTVPGAGGTQCLSGCNCYITYR